MLRHVLDLLSRFCCTPQSWFEVSLHMHSKLIMRADEYAETLQWNLCRDTVASVTAVIEHGVPVATYLRSLHVLIHDPRHKLQLETISGIYQCVLSHLHDTRLSLSCIYCRTAHDRCTCPDLWLRRYDTGFKLAGERLSGRIVAMMAADMLLGDQRRWQSLTSNGTVAFFESESPRMLVLSRLELHDSIESCCTIHVKWPCQDAFVFRSPLHAGVRLDLFNFQQNVWQAENYAAGLLRHGGYLLFNPCLNLPLFHNHISDQRPNQNENRCIVLCIHRSTVPLLPAAASLKFALTCWCAQTAGRRRALMIRSARNRINRSGMNTAVL